MVLAALHVLGAFVACCLFITLTMWAVVKEEERVRKRRLQDASFVLGVPVAALESEELLPRVIQYSSQRCSSELLRNRFSDLCGMVRIGWIWFSALVQLCIVVGVAWSMYASGAENAVYMWAVPLVGIAFWLLSVAFSFACLLLTGRYPGEAYTLRKSIAEVIEQQHRRSAQAAAIPAADA
jgi:hypothetical protein